LHRTDRTKQTICQLISISVHFTKCAKRFQPVQSSSILSLCIYLRTLKGYQTRETVQGKAHADVDAIT